MPNKLIKLENNEMILTPCWLETRIEKYSLFRFTFEKKVFIFFGSFCVHWDSKLVKSANMTPQIFLSKHFDMGIKKRIIEKSVKNSHKKVISIKV